MDDEIVPNLRPEKDIWNLSNDEFYDPKAKSEKGTRGAGVGGLLQHSTPAIELQKRAKISQNLLTIEMEAF